MIKTTLASAVLLLLTSCATVVAPRDLSTMSPRTQAVLAIFEKNGIQVYYDELTGKNTTVWTKGGAEVLDASLYFNEGDGRVVFSASTRYFGRNWRWISSADFLADGKRYKLFVGGDKDRSVVSGGYVSESIYIHSHLSPARGVDGVLSEDMIAVLTAKSVSGRNNILGGTETLTDRQTSYLNRIYLTYVEIQALYAVPTPPFK